MRRRVYDARVKLSGLGCVLMVGMTLVVASGRDAYAQQPQPAPATPAPKKQPPAPTTAPPNPTPVPPPAPAPTPKPGPSTPEQEVPPPAPPPPSPNPAAPPPGTEPAPAPPTTTPAPAIPLRPQPDPNATATEIRLFAASRCNAHAPDCDWIMTFSSLEKLSIRRSLAALGLEIDPAPWGKTVGKIRVYNEDVFAEKNWLQFFNYFHVTTREDTIRGELTINEGQAWDDELIAESARRLKDPLYTGVVALLPTKSAEAGKVDLLVVTRDIWSLRFNTQYTVQQSSLTNLSISLSENNFLGRRKTVAMGFLVDQASMTVGPLYIDKNFLGEHIDFRFRVDKILTRQSLDAVQEDGSRMPSGDPGGLQDDGKLRSEGSDATISMTKTLWSLASTWGWGASFNYRNAIARSYRGTGLRAVDVPSTPELDYLPREYRNRTWSVRASVTRQWGDRYKHQVEGGYGVSNQSPSLLPNIPADPMIQQEFKDLVFPHTELISGPFVQYSMFRATFRTIRNVDTFDLAEDLRLGPNATVGVQQSLSLLGSDHNFTRPSLTVGWTVPWGRDGFARISGGGELRIQSGEMTHTIDNSATAQIRAATPTLGYFRLVAQVHTETSWNTTNNGYYTLGSDSGLRAYDIAQFIGIGKSARRVVGAIEARTVPASVWVFRVGGAAFYEIGGVAKSFNEMGLHHDVGVGFRLLIPQTARDLFRFDFAKPLDGQHDCPLPGNVCFVAGFDSYF